MFIDRVLDALRRGNTPSIPLYRQTPESMVALADLAAIWYKTLPMATVINAQSVADFYFNGTDQEDWDAEEDFPNVAPPWPLAFYEWVTPRTWRSNGHRVDGGVTLRVGLLVEARPLSKAALALEPHEVAKMLARMVLSENHDAHYEQFEPEQLAAIERVMVEAGLADRYLEQVRSVDEVALPAWACRGSMFIQGPNEPIAFAPLTQTWMVSREGRYMPGPVGRQGFHYQSWAPFSRAIEKPVEHLQGISALTTHVPMLTMSFLHCKNVDTIDHVPDMKLQKARAKEGKPPLLTYKTLVIDAMRKVLQREGQIGKNGSQKALHICRGHFKTFPEGRGLFGKYPGTFWWPMHVRGEAVMGGVVKDYAVVT